MLRLLKLSRTCSSALRIRRLESNCDTHRRQATTRIANVCNLTASGPRVYPKERRPAGHCSLNSCWQTVPLAGHYYACFPTETDCHWQVNEAVTMASGPGTGDGEGGWGEHYFLGERPRAAPSNSGRRRMRCLPRRDLMACRVIDAMNTTTGCRCLPFDITMPSE